MQTPGSGRPLPKWIPAVRLSLQFGSIFGHAVCNQVGMALGSAWAERANCSPHRFFHRVVCLYALLLLMLGIPGWAQERVTVDLSKASLEDLMNVRVTSASKREEKLSDVPAAIFVITQEDIRRSGARSIPDLLRMVPGLDVAKIDASAWAISARGFNGLYSNKLLVLVGMAAVFTTLRSAVCSGTR
jgi:TonB-dependent Receptor Plug Domain